LTDDVLGLLLAGGEGRRFGRPKALVEFAGSPLVEKAARTLSAGGCRPTVVVLGASAEEVAETCSLQETVVIVNENWREGMSTSLKAGLAEARRRDAPAVLVMQVDQPVVTPTLVSRLIESWREGAKAAVAAYRGRGRTPVVLDRSLWTPVEAGAVGDTGARGYLRSHPRLVTLVDCDDVGDVSDIDSPEDLARLEEIDRRFADRLQKSVGDSEKRDD